MVERAENRGERIAKFLSRAGIASRRDAEAMIEAGRVHLNNEAVTHPAVFVQPGDFVLVDGKAVSEPERTRLWRYHKPDGLVTTHKDPEGRATVFEHLPPNLPRVISIGRLDLTSEGLLLLTNDGALSRQLELPATGWLRRYRVRVHGGVAPEKLNASATAWSWTAPDSAPSKPRWTPSSAPIPGSASRSRKAKTAKSAA